MRPTAPRATPTARRTTPRSELSPPADRTIIDVLRYRAAAEPDRIAYTFVSDTGVSNLSYRALDHLVAEFARRLAAIGHRGDRVLIMATPGPDFVTAFLGTLSAGLVAVPAYPPSNAKNLARIRTMVADARPVAVAADEPVLALLAEHGCGERTLAALTPVPTGAPPTGLPARSDHPEQLPAHEDVAFLQYTSGSTGHPKGVVVRHGNLTHNSGAIAERMALSADSVSVSWLPPYHDMGLVGGVLQPLYTGFRGVLLPPMTFLTRPLQWLRAISDYRATVSGGPDFAFELCVRRYQPRTAPALDLSSWSVAFSGSEPVRYRTVERFTECFAPAGFRRTAWFPCYGLAESTLLVTGGPPGRAPVLAAGTGPALVGCGGAPDGLDVRIVDQHTTTECPDSVVGEIVVAGQSVASGYWSGLQPERFRLRLPGSPTTYLRTGDLGMLRDGELFVTGRTDDVLIIRGRNHYPQDVEDCAERSHRLVRAGGVAAFTAPVAGTDQLVVLAEVAGGAGRRHDGAAAEPDGGPGGEPVPEVIAAIRRAVAEELGLHAHAITAVRPRTLPRTANGKLRRAEARRQYLAGELTQEGTS